MTRLERWLAYRTWYTREVWNTESLPYGLDEYVEGNLYQLSLNYDGISLFHNSVTNGPEFYCNIVGCVYSIENTEIEYELIEFITITTIHWEEQESPSYMKDWVQHCIEEDVVRYLEQSKCSHA